ncbi:MAG: HypC/HybG/HupF family hydrogenase formation chaperone [Methylocystis silviterrae]|uniref:HypC/HybG/HupF family hydrogenase formation chaperone n=1 Tax=Methylocystis silviterrae TaxID=2743612 RepID=UPI003C7350B1
MCLGVPMRVIDGDDMSALCEGAGRTERISMLLIGAQPPGAHVLVHLGTAMRVLEEEEAALITAALKGLDAALAGRTFEAHFADLIDREPQLPAHLVLSDESDRDVPAPKQPVSESSSTQAT